jgi:hypothetical protein
MFARIPSGVFRFLRNRVQAVLLSAMFFAALAIGGCGNKAATEPREAVAAQIQGETPAETPQAASRRIFKEGGKLTINAPTGPVDVVVTEVTYGNTDPGYPDLVEIGGQGTYFVVQVAEKIEEDAQENLQYQTIAGKRLPVQPLDPTGGQTMSIEVPGSGPYGVTGGALILEKFEHGPSETDWWEGRLELTLQTTAGAYSVTGTFSFGIVPVW